MQGFEQEGTEGTEVLLGLEFLIGGSGSAVVGRW
jgi:hypothetical protein